MGLLRKLTSMSTLGVVPYRNKAEKLLNYTKQTRNYTRGTRTATRVGAIAGIVTAHRQGQMMRAKQGPPPRILPAGWYSDAADKQFVAWWDGVRWIPESRRHVSQLEWR